VKITWMRLALGLVGLALAGALVVVSGVVPVKASNEHWPVTRWFLSFAMSRSVSTHSLGIDVPSLDEAGLVVQGAGHYELGCVPCHGRPGLGRSEVILETTPHPPLLEEVITLWSPAELYQIVRHGVKFTAMPAWPVDDRDDEVWAMVAFLRLMPELDETGYLALAYGSRVTPAAGDDTRVEPGASLSGLGPPVPLPGDDSVLPVVRERCAGCHGVDGRGRGVGTFPSIAGQRGEYLAGSLEAFRTGVRASGTMHAVASALPPSLVGELASHYEAQGDGQPRLLTLPPDSTGLGWLTAFGISRSEAPSAAAAERGEEIATRGKPELELPSCASCHGPAEHPRNPAYPLLAGQYFDYLASQLRLFQAGVRGGTEYVGLMHEAVRELEEGELLDLAAYYSTLR
jgi:cytochrome c553